MKQTYKNYWCLMWRSKNEKDGESKHYMLHDCLPCLFRKRREARAYASKEYGYIKHRKDLRSEPHGWRLPKPVRVTITVEGE